DVVLHAPPFHARPVADDESGNRKRPSSGACWTEQLAEGLHAVEQALRGAARNQHAGVGYANHVALLVEIVFIRIMVIKIMVAKFVDFHSLRFEIGPQAAV